DQLLAASAEDRVALRPGARYGLRLGRSADRDSRPAAVLDAEGAYLITGGLGALGLHAARSLAQRGARHLALVGRRAPSETALGVIAELRDAGVAVEVFQADVADAERVAGLTAEIRATMGPLRGVVHAAGVLD